eukprot:600997-Rhodomonas_salina.1
MQYLFPCKTRRCCPFVGTTTSLCCAPLQIPAKASLPQDIERSLAGQHRAVALRPFSPDGRCQEHAAVALGLLVSAACNEKVGAAGTRPLHILQASPTSLVVLNPAEPNFSDSTLKWSRTSLTAMGLWVMSMSAL